MQKKKKFHLRKLFLEYAEIWALKNINWGYYLHLQDSYHSTSSSEAGKDSIDPEINEKGKQV